MARVGNLYEPEALPHCLLLAVFVNSGEVKMEWRSVLASKDNIRYIRQKGTMHCQEVFLSCWLYFQDHGLGLMLKSLHRILIHVG